MVEYEQEWIRWMKMDKNDETRYQWMKVDGYGWKWMKTD